MSAPITEAHREAAVAIFAIAMKSAHHGAAFREPCAQLIADSEARACEQLHAEVTDANARAERAEAELEAYKKTLAELTRLNTKYIADQLNWDWQRQRDEARAELITRAGEIQTLSEALATERARLDAGQILLTVAGERVWHCGVDLRTAIDAAMKEGAK